MKTCKFTRLVLALFLCLVLCLSQITCVVAAQIDTAASASLSLTFTPADIPAANVQYRLYRVADVSADTQFSYTSKFSSYPIFPVGTTAENWRMLAETLQGFIAFDAVAPDYTAVTDENGAFSLNSLPTGLYLLTGDVFINDGTVYIPQPFLLCLPSQSGNEWEYSVTVDCKYTRRSQYEDISVSVLKIWNDVEEVPASASVTVALLGDNTLYDTVTLDQSNNWCHTWDELSPTVIWTVAEIDIYSGFTVEIEQEDDLYAIHNYAPSLLNWDIIIPDPPTEPDSTTDIDGTTDTDNTTDTDSTTDTDGNNDGNGTDEPELPNTGVLWWPVPVMGLSGIVCLAVGMSLRRGKENEK